MLSMTGRWRMCLFGWICPWLPSRKSAGEHSGTRGVSTSRAEPHADEAETQDVHTDIADAGAKGPVLRRFNWFRDADEVASFQKDTYSQNFSDFIMTRRFEGCFRHDLRRAANDRNAGLFVIEMDSSVVAFLWVVIYANTWTGERFGYINNLYVRPEYRKRGFGTMLLHKAESFCRGMRVRKIRLTATCSNEAAVELYRKAGYEVARYELEKDLE